MTLERTRYEYRKKKRSRIITIGIAVIALLILFFVFQQFLKSPSEQAASDIDDVEEHESQEEEVQEDPPVVDHTPVEGELIEEDRIEEPNVEEENQVPQVENGQWEPIGTVQSEPFVAVFEKDHINWQEMTKAFQYATALGDDMIIWWVENGGNHQSAVGIVSTFENKNTPYKVNLEWVENKGWRPVNVESLSENEYAPTETEIELESEREN